MAWLRCSAALALGLWLCLTLGAGQEAPARRPSTAQRVDRPGLLEAEPRFRHLTIEDGLSQNAVNALLQDRQGFVWIGTQDGLNRYDGYEFVVFRHDPFDPATLSSSYVTALHEDAEGYLWVGTVAGGVNRLDPATGAVIRFAHSPRYRVNDLLTDARGNLWVATSGGWVYRLSRSDAGDPEATFEQLTPTRGDMQESPAWASSVAVDAAGTVWIGTGEGLYRVGETSRGLDFYDPRGGTSDGLLDPGVTALTVASDGTLWIGTPRGLSRLVDAERGRFASFPFPEPIRGYGWQSIRQIVESGSGTLWCATLDGLSRFDPQTGTYTVFQHDESDPESLSSDVLSSLMRDRTGVLWVGTNGYGLDRYDAKMARFQTIRRPAGLPSKVDGFSIRSLYEDASGTLWISAGELYRYDRRTGTLSLFAHPGSSPDALGNIETWSILQDRRGDLWFATAEGLFRYDAETGRSQRFGYDPAYEEGVPLQFSPARPEELPPKFVRGVFEDRSGTIWALTIHHISRLDDVAAGRFTHYRHTPEGATPSGDTIFPVVHEDADGTFWISTEVGLVRFDPQTGAVERFRTDPSDPTSLSHDQVRSILHDPSERGVLWIGTAGGGLNRFDIEAGTFTHITERDGLPNNVVYGVLPDGQGRLWMSTNRGLARYDPRSGAIQTYDAHDGLQSNEFNAGAYHRAADGRLYFGGIYGVSTFDPDAFEDNPHVPPVVLTGLRIGDRPVVVGGSTGLLERALWATERLRLSHRENMVTFSFAALDFSASAKNRYAYRMEGFDDGWIQAGTNHTATYTNLPPGRYTFHVRGSNNDGVWNEEGATLAIAVMPPPWRAWWAYLGYGLLAAGLLTAAYRARRRRHELRHRLELEQLEAEKLRELDQSRSRFFANVSHEFRTPLTLTLGPLDDLRAGLYGPLPAPMAAQVDLARRNAGRVLDLINQILDVARIEAGRMPLHARPVNLGAFVEAVAQPFQALALRSAITFEVARPAAPVEVYADPAQLEKVMVNLIANAFKFTPEGGAVRVTVAAAAGSATLGVRDSGPGIPAADLPHVFDRFYQVNESAQGQLGTGIGLALAKEVVDLHGGRLEVESEEGFGSLFTVALPLGRAHLTDAQVARDLAPWAPAGTVPPRLERPFRPAPDDLAPDDLAPDDLAPDDLAPDDLAPDDLAPDDLAPDDVTTVLVVEDHPEVRAYLRRHLEASSPESPGYRVLEAGDGEAGLALARARLPDLVLSDVMMPKLDGLGLCRALKADPETDFIPVVLLTAKAGPEDRLEGLAELCDDYLTKPFSVAELKARIANLIGLRKRLRERYAAMPPALNAPAAPPLAPGAVMSADDAFLERVRDAVEEHLGDETFSVERLAEGVGVSRGHLHRQLKALLGLTPTDLLRTMRLQRAAQLLQVRVGTVSEVAYAVGFKSVSHFSDSFVQAYGCRPSGYADHVATEAPAGR